MIKQDPPIVGEGVGDMHMYCMAVLWNCALYTLLMTTSKTRLLH